jgi:hypothetical protein
MLLINDNFDTFRTVPPLSIAKEAICQILLRHSFQDWSSYLEDIQLLHKRYLTSIIGISTLFKNSVQLPHKRYPTSIIDT